MKLSIIVVNYRSFGYLEDALNALQPGFPADWEIIVVDNESLAEELEPFAARYPWVTFVANDENSGFGFGSNMGVERASGERLLFMNPDVVATADELRALLAEQDANPDAALLAPLQLDGKGRPQKVFDDFPAPYNQSKVLKKLLRYLLPGRFVDPHDDYDELVYCDWVTGSVLLTSRADFDRMGGWCEDYWMYVEDCDICRRAHDLGLKVGYTPRIRVTHTHGGSSRVNIEVKTLTKLEVIISKHVYAALHFTGLRRWLMHLQIALLRLPSLLLAAVLDIVTVGRIPTLRVRSRILLSLMRYYPRVLRTGSWLSPRAIANIERRATTVAAATSQPASPS